MDIIKNWFIKGRIVTDKEALREIARQEKLFVAANCTDAGVGVLVVG